MTPRPDVAPIDVDERFRRFCSHGDTAALADVFAAVAPWLTRRAMHLTRDPLSAMDLVQSTFVTAIEIRERFDANGRARPWLRGILENKARRPMARSERPNLRTGEAEDQSAPGFDPAERAMQGELATIVRQAIDRLPEPYRPVLQRTLLYDETAEQIAAALARPRATVRSQVRRGLERLRLALPACFGALLRALAGRNHVGSLAGGFAAAVVVLAVVAAFAWRSSLQTTAPLAATGGGTQAHRTTASPAVALAEPPDAMRMLPPLASPTEEPGPAAAVWTLAVRQVGDTPAPDLELVLESGGGDRQRFVTDAAGLVSFPAPQGAGPVIVEVPFAGVRRQLAGHAAADGTPRDTLVLPPGFSVAGVVVDDAGRPLAAARVLWIQGGDELQVARSDEDGRFVVRHLRSGQPHRLRAVLGARASAEATLAGPAGTTADHRFHLDRPFDAQHSTTDPADVPAGSLAPLVVEFLATDGTDVHGWLAVLSTDEDDVAIVARPIVGNVATFPPVPLTGLRCTLLPPDADGGVGAGTDALLLTRRHGSVPRALRRQGERAVFEVHGGQLPSAWLRLAPRRGGPLLAERAVLLDRSGRPHGIFLRPAAGIGPILPGTWTLALLAKGHEIEYRGPFEVAAGGVYPVADCSAEPAAVLRLRSANGLALAPPLEALWVCAADVLLTLEPRTDQRDGQFDDLRVAPGDYVLYWRQRGLACSRMVVRAQPGIQDVVLAGAVGSEVALEFDFGRDDGVGTDAARVARLDVTVRDPSGATLWRERLHGPTDRDGRLRAVRRLATGAVLVEAVDGNGARGAARLRSGDEHVRVVMAARGDDRPR